MTTPSEEYREIPLTQGQVAKVSPHRFEELNQWKWQAWWNSHTRSFYAVRNFGPRGSVTSVKMHRYILGLETGNPLHGDHINHDTLDNRDENIRVATPSQNQANQGKRTDNTSGFKGVSWHKQRSKWTARIRVNGCYKSLGLFELPEDAYAAYREAAKRRDGDFIHSSLT